MLGVCETHLFGQGVNEGGNGSECSVWEGDMKDGTVWAGLD